VQFLKELTRFSEERYSVLLSDDWSNVASPHFGGCGGGTAQDSGAIDTLYTATTNGAYRDRTCDLLYM
jgi:hypothetical protein